MVVPTLTARPDGRSLRDTRFIAIMYRDILAAAFGRPFVFRAAPARLALWSRRAGINSCLCFKVNEKDPFQECIAARGCTHVFVLFNVQIQLVVLMSPVPAFDVFLTEFVQVVGNVAGNAPFFDQLTVGISWFLFRCESYFI